MIYVGVRLAVCATALSVLAGLAEPDSVPTHADANPTPTAQYHLEGTLVIGIEGCLLLQTGPFETWELIGDLQGFGAGDNVEVWGNLWTGATICLQGTPLEVKKIVGPVGGIAELPSSDVTAAKSQSSSAIDSSTLTAAIVAGGLVTVVGAVLYSSRRRLR